MKNTNNKQYEEMYLVIDNYKGNEVVVFSGTKKECSIFEDQARADLIRRNGDDIVAVNDFYTVSKRERERMQNRDKLMEEYKSKLTHDELEEIIEIDGKNYAKWILDFNKEFNK